MVLVRLAPDLSSAGITRLEPGTMEQPWGLTTRRNASYGRPVMP